MDLENQPSNHPSLDSSQMAVLYADHAPALLAAARRIASDEEGAEDLVAETMFIAWQKLPTLEGEGTRRWLLRVLRNRGIDAWRSNKRFERLRLGDDETDARGATTLPEIELLDLWAAVEKLPVQRKKSLLLHYISGFSVKEVAFELNLSDNTVKTHLKLALADLRTGIHGPREPIADRSLKPMKKNLILAYAQALEARNKAERAALVLKDNGFHDEYLTLVERTLARYRQENKRPRLLHQLEMILGLRSETELFEEDLADGVARKDYQWAAINLEHLGRDQEAKEMYARAAQDYLQTWQDGPFTWGNRMTAAYCFRKAGDFEAANAAVEAEVEYRQGCWAKNEREFCYGLIADPLRELGREEEAKIWDQRCLEVALNLLAKPDLPINERDFRREQVIDHLTALGRSTEARQIGRAWIKEYQATQDFFSIKNLAYRLKDEKLVAKTNTQMQKARLAGAFPW
jgi:RNA polymerase sigma-70 factor (ECF subfamily)